MWLIYIARKYRPRLMVGNQSDDLSLGPHIYASVGEGNGLMSVRCRNITEIDAELFSFGLLGNPVKFGSKYQKFLSKICTGKCRLPLTVLCLFRGNWLNNEANVAGMTARRLYAVLGVPPIRSLCSSGPKAPLSRAFISSPVLCLYVRYRG